MQNMKSLFTVIIIFLLPLSVYGVEWTVKYPMIQPDGSVKETKVSVPNHVPLWEPPYLAGRWKCQITRLDNKPPTSSIFSMTCFLKGRNVENISVMQDIRCNDKRKAGWGSHSPENSLYVYLSETKTENTTFSIQCKL